MGRHNKASKERKAKAREENKPVETSIKDAVVKPSAPEMTAEVSATNSSSVESKSKAVEFVQASEDQRPQETVRGNGTANGSCLINERGKEFGRANEAMKAKVAACGWSQIASGDLPKFEQPSKLDGLQKPRVEGSNPVENKGNGVGYSAQSHSGDFRTAGNGRVVLRGGSNSVENKVNGVGYWAQVHSEDFRTAGNGSCLINERGKESGRANEGMKTEGAPRSWSQFVNGDVRKIEGSNPNPAENSVYSGGNSKLGEEASSVARLQGGLQKPRVEGSAENNVYRGGNSKTGEVSSVVTLRPSKLEARQNPRVEGSNPVENKGNGVGYSAQSHSGDFRTAGNGRVVLTGGYRHQARRAEKPRVEGSNSVENKVNGVGYSAQSHPRDFRTADNGRGSIRAGGYGHQASESQVDDLTRIDSLGRLLSSILRHQAAELGLDIRSDGYVFVKDLLKLRRRTHAGFPLTSHTVDDIKEVVRMDKKERFGLLEENGQLLIRANQGHSIQTIKSEDLLIAVCFAEEEVPVCVHGTYLRNLDAIQKEGLKRMGRNHVHFATGLLKDKSVISGMRSDCEVLIHLDVQKYLKDGMKLYRSANGVILAEGKNGVIPPNYFAKIERRRSQW